MYCENCGEKLSGTPRFCPDCGASQRASAEDIAQPSVNRYHATPSSSSKAQPVKTRSTPTRKLRKVANIVGGFLFFCVATVFVVGYFADDSGTSNSSVNSGSEHRSTSPTKVAPTRVAPTKAPSKPPLEILDISTKDAGIGDGSSYVYVDIVNYSDKLFSYVGIDATCRNASGGVVATGLGNTMNVAPGETTTITVVMLAAQGCDRVEVKFDSLTGLFD